MIDLWSGKKEQPAVVGQQLPTTYGLVAKRQPTVMDYFLPGTGDLLGSLLEQRFQQGGCDDHWPRIWYVDPAPRLLAVSSTDAKGGRLWMMSL
jgi:hypothetical protein